MLTRLLFSIVLLALSTTASAAIQYNLSGTGSLTGIEGNSFVNGTDVYSGSGQLTGNTFTFTLVQEASNLLSVAVITSTGTFDITTGVGTSSLVGCTGPALICDGLNAQAGIPGAYSAGTIIPLSDGDFSWGEFTIIDTGFGDAESEYTIVATKVSAVPVPGAVWLFGSSLLGLFGCKRRT